jgi:hypothetical protein
MCARFSGSEEVRWEPAGKYTFCHGKGNDNPKLGTGFLCLGESYQQLRELSLLYIILRGHWFRIIVLNVHALTEDKIGDVKDSFYEELERVFDKFPKYHMKFC